MLKRLTVMSLLALLPLCVYAQTNPFDMGDAVVQTPAWQQFKLPKKTVSLNFKAASPDSVLAFFSKASGIVIVNDPTLTAALDVYSPKAVSLSDAFNILNAVLGVHGFNLQKQGNLMVVKAEGGRGGRGQGNFPTNFNFPGGPGGNSQNVLKSYPIQYASATAVAKTFNDVFSPDQAAALTPGGGFGRFGGAVQLQISGAANANRQNGPQIHASADEFSNTLIVNAPQNIQDEIANLLKVIDKPAEEPYQSKVYPLQYASSDDLAPVIQNVLASNAPTGRGTTNGTQSNMFDRFAQAARLGSASAAFGTVVSEPRTNSLIVTGTPENQALVKDIIGNLDKPIKFADSAKVISLNNARADNVAYIINQALQSKVANTQTSTLSSYGNTGNNILSNLNRFQSTGSTANRGTPNGLDINPNNSDLALTTPGDNSASATSNPASLNNSELASEQAMVEQAAGDPNLDPMALETSIAVQGGFNQAFRGLGQNSNSSQQTAPQQTRNEQGQIVNVHNLTGNVTVIPDVNSNSVIVVTNPENMNLVQQILDQLDRTPPQVMIQTIIVEVNLDKTDKFGVEWSVLTKKFGTLGDNFGVQSGTTSSTATTPPGFTWNLTNGQLTSFLQLISQDTRFKVLETPRIFAANNQQAEVNVSQSIPYITNSEVDALGNLTTSYAFENVGVVLDIQPQITSNGMVNLAVVQTANELESYTSFNAPIVDQRIANTDVSVKDGETIVLGGIIGDTKTATIQKVPLLGDIPIIGNLFRSTTKEDTRTELMIFLTPHIVSDQESGDKLLHQTIKEFDPGNRKDLDDTINKGAIPAVANPPKEGGH